MFARRLNVLSVVWLLTTGGETKRIVSSLVVDTWMVDVCQETKRIVSGLVVENWMVDVCENNF